MALSLLFNFSAKANNLNVIDRIKELGSFEEPKKYPEDMKKMLSKGCNTFSCITDKATQKMSLIFDRKGDYLLKNPGSQLYGMALFELFYQKRLKDNEKKIKEFMNSWEDKKKYKYEIVSLMKLNEARKKMRSSLGMDLNTKTEEAIENFWLMGDFIEQGKIKKHKVSKAIKKREKLLTQYKKTISIFNSEIKKKKEKEFYAKIAKPRWRIINEDLDDKHEKFYKDINNIEKKFSSLPTDNLSAAKNIDKAFKEITTITKFASQSFNKGDIKIASMILDFASKNISDITKLVPQSISNDMSNVDISKLGKNAFKKIKKITSKLKNKKRDDLTLSIQNMAKIHKEERLNLFQVTKNLKDLGVDALSFENISKVVHIGASIEKDSKNKQVNLLDKKINFTKIYMNNLGYRTAEIKKEIDTIKSIGINNIKSQEILIARHMLMCGASDKEIQKEINDWSAINVNNLNKEAYSLALNMKMIGASAKKIQKKVEMVNAVETLRQVNKLLGQVENQIKNKNITKNIPAEADNEETFIFAQAGKGEFSDDYFALGKDELFFNHFLSEKKNKQIKSFAESATKTYRTIYVPLNIISVIISPNPYNIYKLSKIIKEEVDVKKARILAMSTYGTAEDALGGGDYVDPRIFARTEQVLVDLQKRNIESTYLAKQLNYSITLISVEAEKFEKPEQSDETEENICVEKNCFIPPAKKVPPKSINPLQPIDKFIKNASLTKRINLIEKIELMINSKNITALEVAELTNVYDNFLETQLLAEKLGIADASAKVSAAFQSAGLMKDGMPTLEAMENPNFDAVAHVAAMDVLASEAELHADIAKTSGAASDIQDIINQVGSEGISEELAQQNAEAQQALADAQQALDDSRKDTGEGVHNRFPGGKWDGTGPVPDCHGEGSC